MSDSGNVRIVYVLLDGIGDLPNPELNGFTPLEAANTPNLDIIAKNGCMGNVISVGKGIAPQSDIAVFNMLGYQFNGDYVGRGIIETIGCNMKFSTGDLALRGNFATIDTHNKILDRRAGRDISKNESEEMCNFLEKKIIFTDPNLSVKLVPTISHRLNVLFQHQKMKLSDKISNTDPAYGKVNGIGIAKKNQIDLKLLQCLPEDGSYDALFSAKIVNEFTQQCIALMKDHPINMRRADRGLSAMNIILLRDPGNKMPSLEKIDDKYGIKTACIVDMPVEIGISRVLGMKSYISQIPSDYISKAKLAAKLLNEFNLVYIHIKGPDEFGHDGDPNGKKSNIEQIDKDFFGAFLKNSDIRQNVFVITGDHSTPCITKAHTDDPIPLLISGKAIQNDGTIRFTEQCASKGSLGTILGPQVIPTVLNNLKSS
jgi:2,3-bisphosphoglycerate-independent phosphoglycerate mutase